MLLIILLPLAAGIFWTAFGLRRNKPDGVSEIVFFCIALIFSLATMICSMILVTERGMAASSLNEYQHLKWQVGKIQKIHVNDIRIIQQAQRLNESIQDHKDNYESLWIGIWYSKKIAELEPIKLPEGDGKQ